MKIDQFTTPKSTMYVIVEDAIINYRLKPLKQYLVVGETENRYRLLIDEIRDTHAIVGKKQVQIINK